MEEVRTFRVFVSSPGDVLAERKQIRLMIERLNGVFQGLARFEPVLWEEQYYTADETFQGQISEAADCDLVLAIFKARLGTPLPDGWPKIPGTDKPYPSGSAYEVLTSIEARRAGRPLPDTYVFRFEDPPQVSLEDTNKAAIEAEWQRLKGFFDVWFKNPQGQFLAGMQWYRSPEELAQQVEDCLRQWLKKQGIVPEGPLWYRQQQGSPFPGLEAFDVDRRVVFFGRKQTLRSAIFRLRQASLPFLLLIGASGSGKSSLLRAALVPEMTLPGILPVVDHWRTLVLTAGANPFDQLARGLLQDDALGEELRQGAFETPELLAQQLQTVVDTATLPLREALGRVAATQREARRAENLPQVRLLLAIDQIERWFMEGVAPAQIEAFTTLLGRLVEQSLITLVLVLRSDAYARFQSVPALVHLRESGALLDVLPPTPPELEEIITGPVLACRPPLAFAQCDGQSLASRLVVDAQGGDALPLLQMTLQRLYAAEEERGDGILACADYHGLADAVTESANAALASVDEAARAQLPALVRSLVQDVIQGPNGSDLVPVVVAADRTVFEAQHPERMALVQALIDHRLLTSEGDAHSQRLRPAHESLMRIWPQAQDILMNYAEQIHLRATLEVRAHSWREAPDSAKDEYLQLPAIELDSVKRFGPDFEEILSVSTREFLVKLRDKNQKLNRQLDAAKNVLAVLSALASYGLGLIAVIGMLRISLVSVGKAPSLTRLGLLLGVSLIVLVLWCVGAILFKVIARYVVGKKIDLKSAMYINIAAQTVNEGILFLAILFHGLGGVTATVIIYFLGEAFLITALSLGSGILLYRGSKGRISPVKITTGSILWIAVMNLLYYIMIMHHNWFYVFLKAIERLRSL
ncbi:nSTAND1 domain-containing NTPase [Acidithiobacillus sulfuriphilus]|uniref:nSTAND1 domain-containing NTPase n=1 Tax=Acidithiobacillus sulfuriphilus TaxID=1867749 RepID=UPI003F5FEDAB